MTLAAETRAAVRARPFVYDALRAGVVNYTALARYLDVGDETAVAAALRRYAEALPPPSSAIGEARVSMQGGLGETDDRADALLVVGPIVLAPGAGDDTAIQAAGDVDPGILGLVLRRLAVAEVPVVAAGAVAGSLLVVVERRAGADALRLVEAVLD